MNAEYHRRLRLDDYRTFDEYLRERIRRGLQAHHDHTEMLLHLQINTERLTSVTCKNSRNAIDPSDESIKPMFLKI